MSCIDTKEETKRLSQTDIINKAWMWILKSRWVEIETIEIGGMLDNFNFYSNQRDKNREVMNDSQIGFIQTYPWASQTLRGRLKRQRLITHEKIRIYDLVINHKVPIKNLVWDLHLSASTIKSIIKKGQSNKFHKWNDNANTKRNLMSSCLVQNLIEDFLHRDNNPKTVKDVWIYIFEMSGIKIPIHLARQYMKEKLCLTYKIGKSRPALLDEKKRSIIKSYFAVRVIQILPNIDIIVNIDEACFSHYLMKNRSWIRKGYEGIVTNKRFSGSVSLISCITSIGWSFNATVAGTINHKLFIEYLTYLMNFLTNKNAAKRNNILIILDNASSHKTGSVKEFIEKWGAHTAFIPTYSPELAPVEKYFGLLKDIIRRDKTYATLNWKSKQGIQIIADSIKKINPPTIKRIWKTFFKEIYHCLEHLSNTL